MLLPPIRDRLLRSEELLLSASNEDLMQDFQRYWHALAIDILNATNAGRISSEDLALADAVSARITTFCENFEEFSQVCDEIGNAFERDLERILEEHGQALRHSKSKTFQPPAATASYIRPAYHWLLHNLHNPYPPKETRDTIAHETASDPKHVDNWFADIRKRMGWNAIRKRHFSNKRHLTVDAATTFFKNQSSNLLNGVVCHDFTAMSASAKGLYASKFGKTTSLDAKDSLPVSSKLESGLEKERQSPIQVFRSTSTSSKECLVNSSLSSPSVTISCPQHTHRKRPRTPEVPVGSFPHRSKRARTEGAIRLSAFSEDSCSILSPTSELVSGKVAADSLVSMTPPAHCRSSNLYHKRLQTMTDPFMQSRCSPSPDDPHLRSIGATSCDLIAERAADPVDCSSLPKQRPSDFSTAQEFVSDPQAPEFLTQLPQSSFDTLYPWDQFDVPDIIDLMPGHSMFDKTFADLITDNDIFRDSISEQGIPEAPILPLESNTVAHWTDLSSDSRSVNQLSMPLRSIASHETRAMETLSSAPVDLDFGHFFNPDSQFENISSKNVFENMASQQSPHSGPADPAITGIIQLEKLRTYYEQLGRCIKSLEQQITDVTT